MKKIGFIDYFLDEWHAEKYPEWIEAASGGRMKVTSAFGLKDSANGLSNADWCRKKGIRLLPTISEVIEDSDYLVVLSPDNPEFHEELSMLPLQSGKPTYIDKTFAPDRQTALRLFEAAAQHGTPMYSTSALRFASEYVETDRQGIDTICSMGPGRYDNYSIHQIEPIVSFMGSNPRRVMYIGTPKSPALLIGFDNGRQAALHHFAGDCPFSLTLNYDSGSSQTLKVESDFFSPFIQNLIHFFDTGTPAVDPAETIAVISVYEYGLRAAATPYQWVELPR